MGKSLAGLGVALAAAGAQLAGFPAAGSAGPTGSVPPANRFQVVPASARTRI